MSNTCLNISATVQVSVSHNTACGLLSPCCCVVHGWLCVLLLCADVSHHQPQQAGCGDGLDSSAAALQGPGRWQQQQQEWG